MDLYQAEFVENIKKIREENKDKKRAVYLPRGSERTESIIIFIFKECFSLWYFLEDGKWLYDGWEIGDYRNQWLEETIARHYK